MTTFTGRPGNVNAEPSTFVPMFGAGGVKRSQSLTAQLSFTGSIIGAVTHAFHNLSVTLYRAVYRAYARWSSYPIAVLGDSPVGYWRLTDPVGAVTAYDLSGFAELGTILGTVMAGVSGALKDTSTAMQFDGLTGYIELGNPIKFQSSVGSLEAWVKTTTNVQSGIFTKPNAYGMWVNGGVANLLQAFDFSTSSWRTGTKVINDGVWHHVVFVYQSGVVNGSQFYVDGVPDGPAFTYTIALQNLTFEIAGYNSGSQLLAGSVQEVAFYPYVLTPQQVSTHYNADLTYPPAGFATTFRTSQ